MDSIIAIISPWYKAIATLLFFLLIRFFYRKFLLSLLHHLTSRTSFTYLKELLEAFEQPINIVLFVTGVYLSLHVAPVNIVPHLPLIEHILRSVIVLCFFLGCYNICSATHGLFMDLLSRAGIHANDALSNIFSTVLHFLIIILGFLTVAREWDYDMSAFIASLGIGSLAIAFAAKDALANVFGSLIIILEKPFAIGDWILADNIEGTVEKISFRSTCIRTLPQELVYIPNSLLSNTPIVNFTRREKRRIDFIIGLTYGTTYEQMETFIKLARERLLSMEDDVYEDDLSVNFVAYGDCSLNVRIICYIKTGIQLEYLKITEKINLALMQVMEEAGVHCAFPSTSVYFETPLQQENAKTVQTPPEQK